jgi:hypothetical protein
MSISVRKTFSNYDNLSYTFILFLSIVILFCGIIGMALLGYLGTYKSDLKFLTISGLLFFTLTFILSILSLIHKSKMTWRLLVSLPIIAVLAYLTYIFLDLTLEIIRFGWLKCATCP